MSLQKTHREVKHPQVSARYLADYMAASEQAKRTIVRKCKYQAIAPVVQLNEARLVAAKFIIDGGGNTATLTDRAQQIRERLATDEFERDAFDHNADYLDRFAAVYAILDLPDAEILAPSNAPPVTIRGVKVTAEVRFRLRRLTKTNKVRIGVATFRYAKGKMLPATVGEWQSAFLYGYLNLIGMEDGAEREHKLCLTVDTYTGISHRAPTDSASRFKNMAAACESIAERWPNIPPPPKAVF